MITAFSRGAYFESWRGGGLLLYCNIIIMNRAAVQHLMFLTLFVYDSILKMGRRGLLACCLTLPCSFSPLPVSPFFMVASFFMRGHIMTKYGIKGGLNEQLKGCCYPCALTQELLHIREVQFYEQSRTKGVNAGPVRGGAPASHSMNRA